MSNYKRDWKEIKLPEVLWFQEGPGVRRWQFQTSGIKLINVSNITKEGILDLNKTDRHLAKKEIDDKYSHFLIDPDDFVIASSGISIEEDGFLRTRGVFIREEHLPLCMNTSTIRFKPIDNKINMRFFKYWLDTLEFRIQITRLVTGSAQKNFGPSHLKKLKLTLPPLPEQKRIAAILDKADALSQKRRQALTRLDDLLQSVFLEMFGDPLTNPKEWPLVQFSDIMILKRGYDLPVSKRKPGKYPVLASNGPVGTHNVYKVKGPGVVTGRSGTIGNVIYFDGDYWPLNTALYSRQMFGNNPIYLTYFLRFFRLDRFTRGVGVPTLNRNLVHAEMVPAVPVELQMSFADKVKSLEKYQKIQKLAYETIGSLFNSLQQRAFQGELGERGKS